MNLSRRHEEEKRRRNGQGVMVHQVAAAPFGDMDDLVKIVPVGVIRSLRVVARMVFVDGKCRSRLLTTIQLMNGEDSIGNHGCSMIDAMYSGGECCNYK